nr:hypothetical protein CparaKRNrm1_p037 [Cryptomonas paramecium]
MNWLNFVINKNINSFLNEQIKCHFVKIVSRTIKINLFFLYFFKKLYFFSNKIGKPMYSLKIFETSLLKKNIRMNNLTNCTQFCLLIGLSNFMGQKKNFVIIGINFSSKFYICSFFFFLSETKIQILPDNQKFIEKFFI